MGIHDKADIYLQPPVDRVEFLAHALMNNYKTEARSWYDLARTAIGSLEKYDQFYGDK